MPELTIEEVKNLEQEKKKREDTDITRERKGDRDVYRTRDGKYFTSSGDALDYVQNQKQQAEFKRLGLNEFGQTKEQAARSEKIKALRVQIDEHQEKIMEFNIKIGRLINGLDEEEKPGKKGK